MVEFLRVQYALGKVTAEQLKKLVGIKITEEEFAKIVSQEVLR